MEISRSSSNRKRLESRVLYSYILYKKKQQLPLTPPKKISNGVLLQEGRPVIHVSKKLTPVEQNQSNIEREELSIVFVVTVLKHFLPGRQFNLQTDHKPLKDLFPPHEQSPKTASARITKRAIALMSFDYLLKYTPGEQTPLADSLSRLILTLANPKTIKCASQSLTSTSLRGIWWLRHQNRTWNGTNRLFQDAMKGIKSENRKHYSREENDWNNRKQRNALTTHDRITLRGIVPFLPHKLRHLVLAKGNETHLGKNATDASVRMIAEWSRLTQDVQNFISKCKNCQNNRPSMGKTVSNWPQAVVWEQPHMEWDYVKDQGRILVIVDAGFRLIDAFAAGNRFSETVKVHLCHTFARFRIPKTLVSDNGFEFVSGDYKQWFESLRKKKMESAVYIQELMN